MQNDYLKDYFGLTSDGENAVCCPFHDDTNPSASLNLEKGKFFCHVCRVGHSLETLETLLRSEESFAEELQDVITPENLREYAEEYLESRKISNLFNVRWDVVTDPNNENYGFLLLTSDTFDGIVGRNLIPGAKPKYKTFGHKGLFYVRRENNGPVWITEGVFNALALAELGAPNVAATLGAGTSPNLLYELRCHSHCFISFDNDFAGWEGSQKTQRALSQLKISNEITELPLGINDVNEFLIADRTELEAWYKKYTEGTLPGDVSYIRKFLTNQEELNLFNTGYDKWDVNLGGGLKPGAHIIAAKTGVGKTRLIFNLVHKAAMEGKKVLVNSCEISKRQCWASLASITNEATWPEIENNAELVTNPDHLEYLGEKIKVVLGWSLDRLRNAHRDYDIIVVDYIQRLPGVGDDLQKLTEAISVLSDMARDNEKVVLVVSAFSRGGEDKDDVSSLRGSGMLGYAAASVTYFRGSPKFNRISGQVIKSTRSPSIGNIFSLEKDLGHCLFKEA